MPVLIRPVEERFWEKVDKNGPTMPHMSTPCWVWTGATAGRAGYGNFMLSSIAGKKVFKRAHHVAWFLKHGRWPGFLCHNCDNRRCVRHLYKGTPRTNSHDALRRGRHKPGRTEKGQRATFTYELAEKMRSHRKAGALLRELVAEFECSLSMVHNILRRRQFNRPASPGCRYPTWKEGHKKRPT